MRGLPLGPLGLAALLAACPTTDPNGETGDPDESGETGPEDDYDAPVFVDPASGVLSLLHDQLGDPALRVADVVVGRTHLEIDGRSVGTLEQAGPVGHLEADVLRLRVDGALVEGTHNLRLVTPGTTAPQASADIEVRIEASSRPALSYELGANVVAPGQHVLGVGTGDAGLLLIVADDGPQLGTLSLVRADGANWDTSDVRSLALPGYASDAGLAPAAVGARVSPESDDGPARVRVAWRVGNPGARVDAVELEWGDDENMVGEATSLLDVDALSASQWASVRRPAFLGANVAVEVHAPIDAEQSLPGDEALFVVGWPDGADPAPPERLTFGQIVDLDLTGRAIDLAREDIELSVRVDGRRLSVLRWDPGAALPQLLAYEVGAKPPEFPGDAIGSAAVLGAFGSQTMAAARANGEVSVLLQDVSAGKARSADPKADELPQVPPSGPPAATVAMGTAVFLLPYANKAQVHALLVDGDNTQVQVLAGLFCDEIAMPASSAGNDGGSMAFACVQDANVRLGALFASQGG